MNNNNNNNNNNNDNDIGQVGGNANDVTVDNNYQVNMEVIQNEMLLNF